MLKDVAELLERSLLADTGKEVDEWEGRALNALKSHEELAELALSNEYPPDVRGVAARLFIERYEGDGDEAKLLLALTASNEPLVIRGVALGLTNLISSVDGV